MINLFRRLSNKVSLIKNGKAFNHRDAIYYSVTNKTESNIRSEIDVLQNEISKAVAKYEEAVAANEPGAVKEAIQRNIAYFKTQVINLEKQVKSFSLTGSRHN